MAVMILLVLFDFDNVWVCVSIDVVSNHVIILIALILIVAD